ncbi:hypothetical protein JHW43_005807 [Diplocarpon mali]|nr:hypothetical protein JHW43_005807 [Diplocarpon mali]
MLPLETVEQQVIYTLYNAITITYNIFYHPLRDYPGPRFAAATRLPLTWFVLRGWGPHWTSALHDKYGPVVRVAPNELSYIDKRAWRDIYSSTPCAKYGMKRWDDFVAYFFDQQSSNDSIVSADEEEHRRLRKIFSLGFSKTALVAQEPLIINHIDHLIEKLRVDQKANMVEVYPFTVFNIMHDLLFGESLNLLDSEENTGWVKSMPGYMAAALVLGCLAQLPVFNFFFGIFMPLLTGKPYKRVLQSNSDRVTKRLSCGVERPDLIHFLVDRKTPLSRPELDNAALVMTFAAGDTLPSMLIGLTYLLLRNRTALHSLVEEIRSTFQVDSEITINSISNLKWLEACLNESFRAYPVTPIGFPRIVPNGGAFIAGGWVAGGAIVYVTPLAAYSSSSNFIHAQSYLPERWLPDPDSLFSGDEKAVLQPFSQGPRDCVGKSMALLMIRLIVCKLLWNFDMEFDGDHSDWFLNQKAYGTWKKLPLMVKLRPVTLGVAVAAARPC